MSDYFTHRIELLWDRLAGLVRAAGLDLVHADFRRETWGYVFRVFVGKHPAVTLDDCARVSGKVLAVIRKDPSLLPIDFSLEVSSSGSLQVLVDPEDFRKAVGKQVILRQRERGKRSVSYHQGFIKAFSPEGITCISAQKERAKEIGIPWVTVEFACLADEKALFQAGGSK